MFSTKAASVVSLAGTNISDNKGSQPHLPCNKLNAKMKSLLMYIFLGLLVVHAFTTESLKKAEIEWRERGDEKPEIRQYHSTTNYKNISSWDTETRQQHALLLLNNLDALQRQFCKQNGIKDCNCSTTNQRYNRQLQRSWFCKSSDVVFLKYRTFHLQNYKEVALDTTYYSLAEAIEAFCKESNISPSQCKCPDIDKNGTIGMCQPPIPYICETHISSHPRMVVIAVISILGILGNLHVIVVRMKYWNPSSHYQLIVGLSVADLVFSTVSLVEISAELYSPCTWIYGAFMCKLLQSLYALSAYVDLGFILAIAVERYVGIVHPFTQRFSKLQTRQMVGINVIVGVLLVVPSFIQYDTTDNGAACASMWSDNAQFIYSLVLLVVFFVFPIALTSVLSYQSVKVLRTTMCEHAMLSAMDQRSRARLVSENKKIMRVLMLLLAGFVVLVFPNHLVWIIISSIGKENTSYSLHATLRILASVPYSLHVTINPIIYSVLDKRFRAYSVNILHCRDGDIGGETEYDVSRTHQFTLNHEEEDNGSTSV